MDITIIIGASIGVVVSIIIAYLIGRLGANKKVEDYKSISEAINEGKLQLSKITVNIETGSSSLERINTETKELQELKKNAEKIEQDLSENTKKLYSVIFKIDKLGTDIESKDKELGNIMSKLDLYTRIDEFVENGHFEMPEYLHETSARFVEEIKRVREKQKDLIRGKRAITYPVSTSISNDSSYDKKILDGQVKLMLSAFNIECDSLISKVSPSNYPRTIERIEKLANALEKSAATLHCGFNIKYVEFKFQECQLQYQNSLKKQEEQEEQRLIREQIREEQKAIKEYERAISQAEKEEKMYRDMLEKAREELSKVSDEDKIAAEQRISELEAQLAEAEAKVERAKSMAEQTRKGHVYVISNIGSFEENVYKIGLTRRLEPLDRVKELGDASVPFTFDVHALIYTDDAPALESTLHREFTQSRVNAVNFRKEFFRTDLESIKEAVERIAGIEAEFKMTALAKEYYETRKLRGPDIKPAINVYNKAGPEGQSSAALVRAE